MFAVVFLVWAFPIHYSARRTLNRDSWLLPHRFRTHLPRTVSNGVVRTLRERHACLIEWTPRVVALLPFAAIMLGLVGALDSISGAGALREAVEARTQLKWLIALDLITAALFVAFVLMRRPFLSKAVARLDARRPNLGRRTQTALKGLYYLSAGVTLLIFVVAYFLPEVLADHGPRAMLAPLLLGSLVLFLGMIAREGDRRGVPALAAIIAIFALATGLNTQLNNIARVIRSLDGKQVAGRQIDIRDAVHRWKAANGCETSPCRPAVIVAAEKEEGQVGQPS